MDKNRIIYITILVAALGYFVDIYDLILFSIVRIKSLKGLGITDAHLLETQGQFLLNMQMIGMLTGGILWGILGDKKGRLSVLFGSIIMYSLANIANGFVQTVDQYAVLRFIAGIGLAGELGAGITLVSEIMPKETRGYGTMVVATIGLLGAIVAGLIAETFDWRQTYFIGGGMGIALLALRIGVAESGMYAALKEEKTNKGNFFILFKNKKNTLKYLKGIFIALPIWYCIGILITLAPEFSKEKSFTDSIQVSKAVMFTYAGTAIGDLLCGLLSQMMKSRKKVLLYYLLFAVVCVIAYLFNPFSSLSIYYSLCFFLGIGIGYWAVFVTVAAEQFGTNIRATVTTTAPNFVRGSLVPMSLLFKFFRSSNISFIESAVIVGILAFSIAFISWYYLDETFGKDLNYTE